MDLQSISTIDSKEIPAKDKEERKLSNNLNNNNNNRLNNLNDASTTTSASSDTELELEEDENKNEEQQQPIAWSQDKKETLRNKQLVDLEEEKPRLVKFFGVCLVFMSIVSFLFIGIIINCLQIILVITINFSSNEKWKNYHKYINGVLIYIMFSPPVFLLYYWNRIKLNIKIKDLEMVKDIKLPITGIMIPNHSYELDYMICLILADQLGDIGSYKTLSKEELKYLPIAGWSLWMSDFIFVKRDWSKDRSLIKSKLADLLYYEQCLLLCVFAEGTRFTKEKYDISKKHSISKGLKPLKHHLEPRTRGFSYIIRYYLKELYLNKRKDPNLFKIYNLQIIMPPTLKFKHFLYGAKLTADVYCEPVNLPKEIRNEILKSYTNDDNDDELDNDCPLLNELLRKVYERKDEIVEQYRMNNNEYLIDEKVGGRYQFKTKKTPLIVWLIGFILTYSVFGYLALTVYAKSITFWTIIITYVTGCAWVLIRISKESQSNNNIISNNDNKLSTNIENNNVVGLLEKEDEKDSILLSSYKNDDENCVTVLDEDNSVRRTTNKIIIDNTSPY